MPERSEFVMHWMEDLKSDSKRVSDQGRLVNVEHDARCVMDKVGGDKKPKEKRNFNLLL